MTEDLPMVHFATEEEARSMFDEACQFYLGLSGEEFVQRWNDGEWRGTADQPGIIAASMMLPMVQ